MTPPRDPGTPPQPGGFVSLPPEDAGPPRYKTPLPLTATVVRVVPAKGVDTPADEAPARPLLPTPSELAALPRAAREAFAARCRSRVRPLAPADVPADAAEAVRAAVSVLAAAATVRTPLVRQLRCVRRDFDRIARLAREQNWADDTPVPPDVFGPMWPKDLTPPWAVAPPA